METRSQARNTPHYSPQSLGADLVEHFELGGLNHHLIPRPTELKKATYVESLSACAPGGGGMHRARDCACRVLRREACLWALQMRLVC